MAALAVTVIDHQTTERQHHRFPASPVRIGRDPSNDLHLPHAFVSRWHAVVRFDPAAATLFVLAGGNGVTLAGRRLAAGATLTIDARTTITLGPLELRLEHIPEERAPAAPRAEALRGPASVPAPKDTIMDAAHTALASLEAPHAALRAAEERWSRARSAALAALTPESRALAEAELDAWGPGIGPRRSPTAGPDAAAELVAHLLPGHPLPSRHDDSLRLGRRTAELLRLFAAELLALEEATRSARVDLGLTPASLPPRLPAPLDRLLESLLDVRELTDLSPGTIAAVFADARAHAHALAASALALGDRLARDLDPHGDPGAAPPWWRARRRWRDACERHRDLVGDPARRAATVRALLRDGYRAASPP